MLAFKAHCSHLPQIRRDHKIGYVLHVNIKFPGKERSMGSQLTRGYHLRLAMCTSLTVRSRKFSREHELNICYVKVTCLVPI